MEGLVQVPEGRKNLASLRKCLKASVAGEGQGQRGKRTGQGHNRPRQESRFCPKYRKRPLQGSEEESGLERQGLDVPVSHPHTDHHLAKKNKQAVHLFLVFPGILVHVPWY